MPTTERARRSCATNVNYNEDSIPHLVDFILSDDDGSDFSEDECSSKDEQDELYDATAESIQFNKKLGDDKWVGRRVCKVFPDHGQFEGIVYSVDDDSSNPGYRLFMMHYFEDPNDGESMWPEELARLLIDCVLYLHFAC